MLTKDRDFYRSFFILTVTLMLEQAVVLSVNLADNVMLGGYNETALSGVAAVNQIQFILQQLVFAVSNGMIVLGSQYWGQKKTEPIRHVMAVGFWCAAIIIAVMFAYVSIFPHSAVGIFTNDEAIVAQGVAYLNIVRFSYPFFAVSTVLLGGLRTVEKVKIALYGSIVALVINCTINYALIAGHFGCPELGARGAAIGTLTARIIECGLIAFYLLRVDKTLHFRLRDLLRVDPLLLRDFLRVSAPIILTGFLWGCNTALQTVILGHMSSSAIAAQSISSTLFLFLKVASVGAASSASILIGKAVGSNDMDKLKEYTRTLQVLFVAIGIAMGLILLGVRGPLLRLYDITPETRRLASAFILIESTVLVFMSYQMCMNAGVIRGGGDTKFIMIVDITVIWGIVIPLSFVAAFVWKLSPVWVLIFLNADQYIKCVPAAIYGNSYRWVRRLTRRGACESTPS